MAFLVKNVDWGNEKPKLRRIREKYLYANGVFQKNTSSTSKIVRLIMYWWSMKTIKILRQFALYQAH